MQKEKFITLGVGDEGELHPALLVWLLLSKAIFEVVLEEAEEDMADLSLRRNLARRF